MKNSETKNIQSHSINTGLCDGFLIPMTDFVLHFANQRASSKVENIVPDLLKINEYIFNYAKFLKQPLKLEMFVPCDEDGNLWEYPPTKEEWEWAQKDSADAKQSFKQKEYYYEKAKEKVLFEGFEPYEDYKCAKYEEVYVDEEVCDGKFTVEDLIKDVGKTKIKLSQTALDSIFGQTVA